MVESAVDEQRFPWRVEQCCIGNSECAYLPIQQWHNDECASHMEKYDTPPLKGLCKWRSCRQLSTYGGNTTYGACVFSCRPLSTTEDDQEAGTWIGRYTQMI